MKKLTRYLPIIYAVLIFIGYLNYVSFYKYFDIDISVYLTTSELLFSFLRISIPILVGIGLMFAYVSALLMLDPKDRRNEVQRTLTLDNNVLVLKVLFNANSYKSRKGLYNLFEVMLGFLLGLALTIFQVVFPFLLWGSSVFNYASPLKIDFTWYFLLSWVWYYSFHKYVGMHKFNYQSFLKILGAIIMMIGNLWLFNKLAAKDLLSGKVSYDVCLELDSNKICTDSTLVFVGQTKDFIFLRNLTTDNNHIYKRSTLNSIYTRSVDTLKTTNNYIFKIN